MEPIRILYINGGPMNRGGIESYMMNYYRNFDRNKIQIDFISIGLKRAAYDEEIERLGGKIYYIPKKSSNYIRYIMSIRKIIKTNKYKIIHTHMDAMGMTVLKEAKKIGVPIRIAHSHNTQHLTNNFIKVKINEYARKNIVKYTTHMFACSESAGRWLFGNENFDNGKVEIIKNAIDIDKFTFKKQQRDKLRERYKISENEFVVGHVGRFDYQKNHKLIVKILHGMIKDGEKRIKLVLIGDGHLKADIINEIKSLNLEKYVVFIEACYNINEIYNMFDLFILPSHFEGLGIVAIEAQVNGLYCLVSSKVPKETQISENIEYLDINDEKVWINKIKNVIIEKRCKNINKCNISKLGYNIDIEAKKLQDKYIYLWKENR